MKKIFIGIIVISFFSVFASADEFNAYTEDFFVRVDLGTPISSRTKSSLNISANEMSQAAGSKQISLFTGLEFPVEKKKNFYASFAFGYKQQGETLRALVGDARFIYKLNSWKFFVGGYYGFGVDKTNSRNHIVHVRTVEGGSRNVLMKTKAKAPSIVLSAFELGGEYILNEKITLGVKIQDEAVTYNLKQDTDLSNCYDLTPSSIFDILDARDGQNAIININAVFSVTYSF